VSEIENKRKPSFRAHLLGLLADRDTVVRLVVLPERSSVDLNNGTFHKRLCPDKLVVGGVVDDIDNPGLAGDALGTPREVTWKKRSNPE
jgi:hypothetical protein